MNDITRAHERSELTAHALACNCDVCAQLGPECCEDCRCEGEWSMPHSPAVEPSGDAFDVHGQPAGGTLHVRCRLPVAHGLPHVGRADGLTFAWMEGDAMPGLTLTTHDRMLARRIVQAWPHLATLAERAMGNGPGSRQALRALATSALRGRQHWGPRETLRLTRWESGR